MSDIETIFADAESAREQEIEESKDWEETWDYLDEIIKKYKEKI